MTAKLCGYHCKGVVPSLLSASLLMIFGSAEAYSGQALRTVAEAPTAWVEYATKLRIATEVILGADDPTAQSFRDGVERVYAVAATTEGDPTASLAVNLWVAPDGHVERANLAAFPNAGMNPNLKVLLARVSVGPPPAEMLQPVRLQLRLGAKPLKNR